MTAHGARRVSESVDRMHSPQISTIESAMAASTGGAGSVNQPNTAQASVRLCATVKRRDGAEQASAAAHEERDAR